MSRTITETRMLPYIFTAEEHLENSAEMARLYDQLSELEATHKQIKTSLKEEADALLANLGRVVRFVRDKRDYRKTSCRWIMDCPEVGRKTLRREDTDVDVEIVRMEEHEKQESLNLVPTTEDLSLTDVINQGINPDWDGKINGVKLYEDPIVDEAKEAARVINQPSAMPETAKAEKRTPKFGK